MTCIIKSQVGGGNFVLFLNPFPRLRELPVVSKLKQDSCHKVMEASIYSASFSYFFPFSFICVQSNVKFCHKNFLLVMVSHYHWTQNRNNVTDEI